MTVHPGLPGQLEMSLRVAHMIAGLRVGGAERHLVDLLNAMSCEYRAAIFVGEVGEGASFYQDLDPAIEQHFVRIRRRSLPLGILRLVRVLRRIRVDVLHTHMFGSSLFGAMAARLAGVPVVVTSEHGENPWKGPYHRFLERRLISPLVDARFCVSPQILALRRDVDGVPASKLKLTVNGTRLPTLKVRDAANPVPVIGAVGRFIPAKDYPRLLEAAAALQSRGYRLELCIVGDGPEMATVRRLVDELGIGDIVNLPGLVTDMSRWYERFDLYVSSSIREGQPMALLEAMAHGLPVVATGVGATAETVRHGVAGLIVPPGEPASLAHALGQLLDDAELRKSLGKNARSRVELEYSVNSVADFHKRFYCELLSRSSGAQYEPLP